MRYPDDVGLVWASMARFHSAAAEKLTGEVEHLICFPSLTERPAFATPWATRLACDWYDTRNPASRQRIRELVEKFNIKLVAYVSCLGQTIDLPFLRSLGLRTLNYEADSYPAAPHQSWLKLAAKHVSRRWLKRGVHDRYIANAEHQGRFLARFARIPPERIETIVNGVDVDHFSPTPPPDPHSLDLPSSDMYVVSVSQARPEKRVDVLIDAAAEIFRLRPELSLTFVHVGAGQCLAEWQARAQRLGLAERYRFVCTKADVVPYHRLAAVFAHPAERESFGYAVAEAMACAKPVVAASSLGPAEIVLPGATGTLVEPGDSRGLAQAILALLDDPAQRERMGQAGRERVLRHYNQWSLAVELARVFRSEIPGL